jgi:hypothetical protein
LLLAAGFLGVALLVLLVVFLKACPLSEVSSPGTTELSVSQTIGESSILQSEDESGQAERTDRAVSETESDIDLPVYESLGEMTEDQVIGKPTQTTDYENQQIEPAISDESSVIITEVAVSPDRKSVIKNYKLNMGDKVRVVGLSPGDYIVTFSGFCLQTSQSDHMMDALFHSTSNGRAIFRISPNPIESSPEIVWIDTTFKESHFYRGAFSVIEGGVFYVTLPAVPDYSGALYFSIQPSR